MNESSIALASWLPVCAALLVGTAILSAATIVVLKPLLVRYALARPSARGLHAVPTPQGGGIAVVFGCICCAGPGAWLFGMAASDAVRLAVILAGAAALALLGLVDDIRPLPAAPRLIVQLAIMTLGVMALPEGTRLVPVFPLVVERAVLVLAGAWFINLTNFMDGMDWITVAEMVPVTAALVFFWQGGHLPAVPGLVALGLCGGLLGYAPSNTPPARLFLGDVGSLPIGFLVALGLFSLAGAPGAFGIGPLVAGLLLPLYYLADSGITLLWRLRRREKVWEPHRSHFYQVAVTRGMSVWAVLGRIAVVNGALVILAFASTRAQGWMVPMVCAALGLIAVAALLRGLARSPA